MKSITRNTPLEDWAKRLNWLTDKVCELLEILEEETSVIINTDSLNVPANLGTDVKTAIINIDTSTGNFDINSYSPSGLAPDARIIFRKTDNSANIITYTDNVHNYSFIDRKGDYIELYNDSVLGITI